MKGMVFNLLEEAVTQAHGADAWYDLVDETQVSGAYTSLGSYPDEELVALVVAASEHLGISARDVLKWFGRQAMPMLADKYAVFFERHKSARSFVLSVNEIIHPEVRKLYAGAGCPHFEFGQEGESILLVGYNSPRQLCRLAHGFIEGASDHYGSTAHVEHRSCMLEGDASCQMAVEWTA